MAQEMMILDMKPPCHAEWHGGGEGERGRDLLRKGFGLLGHLFSAVIGDGKAARSAGLA
jgi:hypothetical protein